MKRRMTPQQFLKEYPETAALFKKIKAKAPVKVSELRKEVQPHSDPFINENRLFSMLSNLTSLRLIEVINGVVTLGGTDNG